MTETARALYAEVADLPLVCPHGHVDPRLLADPSATLGTPAELLITQDHYVLRLLHSHGLPLEDLGVATRDGAPVERDHRRIWQRFAERFHLFAGTATGLWLAIELRDLFGIQTRLSAATGPAVYDELAEKLTRPEFAPRALLDRFGVEVLCTTDAATDDLAAHRTLRQEGWGGKVRPTLRADALLEGDHPGWPAEIGRLGELTGIEIGDCAALIAAIEARREAFRRLGAVAVDVGVTVPCAEPLGANQSDVLLARALRGRAAPDDGHACRRTCSARWASGASSTRRFRLSRNHHGAPSRSAG